MGTQFIFAGTTALGTPTLINVISDISTAAGGRTYDVRCFDVTNVAVIAEVTGLANTTPAINSLGAITAPAAPAIFEIQARRSGTIAGPGTVTVTSVEIRY
jgi:hypothetical protein